jgi:hypothetical protein
MKFTDIKQDTPRVVVMFRRDGANEMFQWGKLDPMPVITLIGYITRVQSELPLLEPGDERHACLESALVIVWDNKELKFEFFVHKDIPIDSMVGMLETIKAALVKSQTVQRGALDNQVSILGPDGQPVRRR